MKKILIAACLIVLYTLPLILVAHSRILDNDIYFVISGILFGVVFPAILIVKSDYSVMDSIMLILFNVISIICVSVLVTDPDSFRLTSGNILMTVTILITLGVAYKSIIQFVVNNNIQFKLLRFKGFPSRYSRKEWKKDLLHRENPVSYSQWRKYRIAQDPTISFKKRVKALKKIKDQEVVDAVAKYSLERKQISICLIAAEMLEDKNRAQFIYWNIAKGLEEYDSYKALKKITNQVYIEDIALNGKNERIRLQATERLEDVEKARYIFLDMAKSKEFKYSMEALHRVTNQADLKDVTDNAEKISVRVTAAERIDDKEFVQKFYWSLARGKYNAWTADKVNDYDLLIDLAMNSESNEVRMKVADRMKEEKREGLILEDVYFYVAMNEKHNITMAEKACQNIENEEKLRQISENAASPYTQKSACFRLCKGHEWVRKENIYQREIVHSKPGGVEDMGKIPEDIEIVKEIYYTYQCKKCGYITSELPVEKV